MGSKNDNILKHAKNEAINRLKETPLRPWWWKTKKRFPIRQVRECIGGVHRDLLYHKWYPEIYSRHSSDPINERKVVIVENALSGLSNSFKLIYEDLKASGKYDIHIHHIGKNLTNSKIFEVNGAGLANDVGDARYVFLSEASDVLSCLPLRKETTVVQLWHGCGAFKRFGESTADLIFGQTREEIEQYPQYKHYDYVTVSSPDVVWAYEEAMGLKGTKDIIRPIGVSRTDVFFDQKYLAEASERVYDVVPQARGKRLIIYVPTFRGRVATAKTPSYTKFHLRMLKATLGDDAFILIKHHPIVKDLFIPEMPPELDGKFAVDVTHTLSVEDLMIAADVCITDYSSLIFEYSLLNKPLVFYTYDLEKYFDWRGFYYNFNELTPSPICQTMYELTQVLQKPDCGFDAERMKAFRERFMSSCDGHSTERIEELVFGEILR